MKKLEDVQVGWYATALYLGGLICVMAARHEDLFKLDLNELGDFLAGAFGPLAFAWLVLGFIQQGRELKLSSEALQIQAEELKNSVSQYADMAKSQKTSVINYENAVEPLLKLSCLDSGWSEGEFYCRLNIENLGDYCETLNVVLYAGSQNIDSKEMHSLFSGESCSYAFEGMSEWQEFSVRIYYISRVGRSNMQAFLVESAYDQADEHPYYYVIKLPFLATDRS